MFRGEEMRSSCGFTVYTKYDYYHHCKDIKRYKRARWNKEGKSIAFQYGPRPTETSTRAEAKPSDHDVLSLRNGF